MEGGGGNSEGGGGGGGGGGGSKRIYTLEASVGNMKELVTIKI